MTLTRAVTGFSAAALLALVALAPLPAAAGPTVYSGELVCATVEELICQASINGGCGISIAQDLGASGSALLAKSGAGNANLSLTVKGNGLPASSPVACAVLCVVDGTSTLEGLFEFSLFDPCGTTTAGGKLTHTSTLLNFAGDPFNGGCLIPVPAFWVKPEEGPDVVCAPGFGTFAAFPNPNGSMD